MLLAMICLPPWAFELPWHVKDCFCWTCCLHSAPGMCHTITTASTKALKLHVRKSTHIVQIGKRSLDIMWSPLRFLLVEGLLDYSNSSLRLSCIWFMAIWKAVQRHSMSKQNRCASLALLQLPVVPGSRQATIVVDIGLPSRPIQSWRPLPVSMARWSELLVSTQECTWPTFLQV